MCTQNHIVSFYSGTEIKTRMINVGLIFKPNLEWYKYIENYKHNKYCII